MVDVFGAATLERLAKHDVEGRVVAESKDGDGQSNHVYVLNFVELRGLDLGDRLYRVFPQTHPSRWT